MKRTSDNIALVSESEKFQQFNGEKKRFNTIVERLDRLEAQNDEQTDLLRSILNIIHNLPK